MDKEKSFKTKTGYCHVLPDKIVLTRDGVVGELASSVHGNTIARSFLLYLGLAIVFLYFAWDEYHRSHHMLALAYTVLGSYLIFGVWISRNNSATPVVERNKIKAIKFYKALPYISRSRFVVYFEDDKGNVRKRLILLPGTLSNGKKETELALDIFKDEGLLSSN